MPGAKQEISLNLLPAVPQRKTKSAVALSLDQVLSFLPALVARLNQDHIELLWSLSLV